MMPRVILLLLLSSPVAFAQTAGAQGNPMNSLFLIAIMMAVFYFFMIRPQNKRNKEHKSLMSTLKKGDEIVTNAGIIGRISNIGDNFILLEIAPNTEIKIRREAVVSLMPKGSYKGDLT